jgi:hypothetical protein
MAAQSISDEQQQNRVVTLTEGTASINNIEHAPDLVSGDRARKIGQLIPARGLDGSTYSGGELSVTQIRQQVKSSTATHNIEKEVTHSDRMRRLNLANVKGFFYMGGR